MNGSDERNIQPLTKVGVADVAPAGIAKSEKLAVRGYDDLLSIDQDGITKADF